MTYQSIQSLMKWYPLCAWCAVRANRCRKSVYGTSIGVNGEQYGMAVQLIGSLFCRTHTVPFLSVVARSEAYTGRLCDTHFGMQKNGLRLDVCISKCHFSVQRSSFRKLERVHGKCEMNAELILKEGTHTHHEYTKNPVTWSNEKSLVQTSEPIHWLLYHSNAEITRILAYFSPYTHGIFWHGNLCAARNVGVGLPRVCFILPVLLNSFWSYRMLGHR